MRKRYRVTDIDDFDVREICRKAIEPDGDKDEKLEEFLQGDFFCDSDLLFLPTGDLVEFVTMREGYIIVRDASELNNEDIEVLTRFAKTLKIGASHYKPQYSDANVFELPKHTGSWNDYMRERARTSEHHLIAFRGGQGYGYSLHDMGPRVKVIFRRFRNDDGGIIAIFPEIQATANTVMCYQHVGQHGDCDRSVINKTSPTIAYAPLKKELEGLGYALDVIKRWPNPSNNRR